MPLFQIYHQYENDDSIGRSLNIFQKLLELHYREWNELRETKKYLDQAFVDYDILIQQLKDKEILLNNARQTIDELKNLLKIENC